MPPPTIDRRRHVAAASRTSIIRPSSRTRSSSMRDEGRRGVQRFGPPQRRAALARGRAPPARRCRTGSPCGRRRTRSARPGTGARPAAARSRSASPSVGTDPRLGRAAGALIGDVVASRCRRARRRRARSSATSSAYRSPASITRAGRLCAVKTTSSSACGCAARTRSANASSSSGCVVKRLRPRSNCMPAGSAARRGIDVLLHAQRRELRRQRDADDARRRRPRPARRARP